jgi:NAD(P)-dependent dehydrogenase (short-subunit alcohol dehydrogenase family)
MRIWASRGHQAATPLNRLNRPCAIPALAQFLASDESSSSYIADADFVVDDCLSAL